MAGVWTTKNINFNGSTIPMRVWCESADGTTGPFFFASMLTSGDGVSHPDYGQGAGGANTPRVTIDSGQISAVGAQLTAASVSIAPATDFTAIPISQDTNKILNGNTALTPKFKVITASSSGATTIVALVAAKKIRVLAWDIKVNAAVNFKWQSHVTPTDLTGLYYNSGQGDGVARAFNPVGYFETVAGEALDINLSGAVAVGGVLTYVEV